MYEDQKQSYTMHVPYGDFMMIQNYLEKLIGVKLK